jgi:hypothetical protein
MTDQGLISYRKVTRSSDRNFGLVFAGLFAVIGLLPLWRHGAPRLWSIALAILFLGVVFLAPRALGPLNLLWHRFGLLLHAVVNPVVMFLLYCLAIMPTALIVRARGADLLRLKLDRSASTYWIAREPSSPSPDSMTKQF